jgi:hypothetical protein
MAMAHLPQFGWLGPEAARRAWDAFGDRFDPFRIVGEFQRPARAVLWDVMKQVSGGWLPNIAQQIGDCVSWGCRNAVDHTAVCQIYAGARETFRPSFPPYFYGISRVQIGGGRLGNSDGSLGVWAAEGVRRYGVLPQDAEQCPDYSGTVARQWGAKGPPQTFIELARPHPIKTTARITRIEQLADALANGYAASIASLWGAAMRLKDDNGKSWFTGRDTWPHQMSIIGYDTVDGELCFYRLNSWGPDAHGPQLDGPPGGGWLRGSVLDRELRDSGTECFAFSGFDGFPAQKIRWDAF